MNLENFTNLGIQKCPCLLGRQIQGISNSIKSRFTWLGFKNHLKLSSIIAGRSHSARNYALWRIGWGLLLDLCLPHGRRQESDTGNFVQFDNLLFFVLSTNLLKQLCSVQLFADFWYFSKLCSFSSTIVGPFCENTFNFKVRGIQGSVLSIGLNILR